MFEVSFKVYGKTKDEIEINALKILLPLLELNSDKDIPGETEIIVEPYVRETGITDPNTWKAQVTYREWE